MNTNKNKIIITILCFVTVVSLVFNVVLVYKLEKSSRAVVANKADQKILDFRNMFTSDVLLSDQPIDFNTRLSLETTVRNLNDPAIFNQWEAFANSQTQADATAQAKTLLKLLIQKTSQ